MPITSIIITTHDRPRLLKRAVESALSAGSNVEVIVVDDASGDETNNLCKTMPGIKYVRVDHQQRVAGARNIGLLASTGEYLTFLDDDDARLPESIDRQLKLLEANPYAGMVYGQAICLDQEDQPTQIYPQVFPQGDVFWDLLEQNFVPCGSAVFRRSCLEKVGLVDDGVPGIEDWDLWVRIGELFPVIACVEPVIYWRQSTPASGQLTSSAASIVSTSVRQYLECWTKLPRLREAEEKKRREAWQRFSRKLAAHLCGEVKRCLRHRHLAQAATNLFALPSLGPTVYVRLAREYASSHRL